MHKTILSKDFFFFNLFIYRNVLFGTVYQLVLVGALVAGLNAPILPQDFRVIVKFLKYKKRMKLFIIFFLDISQVKKKLVIQDFGLSLAPTP